MLDRCQFVSGAIILIYTTHRLKASEHDMHSLSGLLNTSGTTRTAHLAGLYPLSASLSEPQKKIYDLSAIVESRERGRSAVSVMVCVVIGRLELMAHSSHPRRNMDDCRSCAGTSRRLSG